MAGIKYPFVRFPFFDGRRPILAKGSAFCEVVSIGPKTETGESGKLQWRITKIEMTAGKKHTAVNLASNEWLNQDFGRWLRGCHGLEIEKLLRQETLAHQGE